MANYNFSIFSYLGKTLLAHNILTGQRYGRWLVCGYAGRRKTRPAWHVICKCGNGRTVDGNNLQDGISQSCGCLKTERITIRDTIHGEAGKIRSPEFRTYLGARSRCNNPNVKGYANYGGRGIEFRFKSFQAFLNDVGRKPTPQHSLDRIDPNGHYEVGNIRWATSKEQSRNKRKNTLLTFNQKTQCVAEWADEIGISRRTISSRMILRWCVNCILTIPVNQGVCFHIPDEIIQMSNQTSVAAHSQ